MSDTTAIPVRLPKATIEALDELAEALGTPNRAEAIRYVIRKQIGSVEAEQRIYQAMQKVLRARGGGSSVMRLGMTDALRDNIERATVPGESSGATVRRALMSDWDLG